MSSRCYDELVARIRALGELPRVRLEEIGRFEADGRGYPMFVLHIGAAGDRQIGAMIAAGIHGDEPAGVEAALRFVESTAADGALLEEFFFVVFPCNNPTGYELDTRENWRGIDLNREFNARRPEPEACIVTEALRRRCFDLVFEMHEDVDSPGFYLYEITLDESDHVGEAILEAVAAAGYPINRDSEIEGMPARGGLIRRSVKRFRKTRLPQAIYTHRACGGHVLTLEPPASVLPLEERVQIQLTGLRIALASRLKRAGRG